MKILLIGNYLPDRQESMQRLSRMFQDSLQAAGIDAELLIPPTVIGKLRPSGSGLGKWLGYIDKYLIFPRLLKRRIWQLRARGEKSLLVHISDHSNAFYTRFLAGVPHLVTCHDVLAIRSALGEFAENRTGWSGRRLQSMILSGLNRARHVACISTATLQDLLRISTLRQDQVSLVPNAFNYRYAPMPAPQANERIRALLEQNGLPPTALAGDFLLHVGGNQWYKNRMGVVRIYSHLVREWKAAPPPSLVMVGKSFTPEMRAFVAENHLQDLVFQITHCDNEDLRALYSRAFVLLFPSLAEGFGWPIIEAQACRCPVACSSGEPFLEAAGGAALMHDPRDEKGFAHELAELWEPGRRESLVERGLENPGHYSPETMIETYRELYVALLAA